METNYWTKFFFYKCSVKHVCIKSNCQENETSDNQKVSNLISIQKSNWKYLTTQHVWLIYFILFIKLFLFINTTEEHGTSLFFKLMFFFQLSVVMIILKNVILWFEYKAQGNSEGILKTAQCKWQNISFPS